MNIEEHRSGVAEHYLDDLLEDCNNCSALAMVLLQFCAKQSILDTGFFLHFS